MLMVYYSQLRTKVFCRGIFNGYLSKPLTNIFMGKKTKKGEGIEEGYSLKNVIIVTECISDHNDTNNAIIA